jgi:AhpD family alkylhydroperoxidase
MSHDDNANSITPGATAHAASPPYGPAHHDIYTESTRALADQRTRLAPGPAEAFRAFSTSVFAPAALPTKTKQLIAVAVAHVTQCPYCIRSHTRAALRQGATSEEIMEAIWVAAEMRAGGAYAHSALALDTIAQEPEPHAHLIEEIARAPQPARDVTARRAT